jgi:DNA repair protein RadD
MNLRDYQTRVIEDFGCTIEKGTRRVILVAPTGAGKTVIAAAIIKKHAGRGALVLAHRREIIVQTSQKLYAHGITHGIIQAGVRARPLEHVQVASIQTLYARAIRGERMDLPAADLLIIDECHHAPAETYRKIIDAYPNAILLGIARSSMPIPMRSCSA